MVHYFVDIDYLTSRDFDSFLSSTDNESKITIFTRDTSSTIDIPLSSLNKDISVIRHEHSHVLTFISGLIEGLSLSKKVFKPFVSMLPSIIKSRMEDEQYEMVTDPARYMTFQKLKELSFFQHVDDSSEDYSSSDESDDYEESEESSMDD